MIDYTDVQTIERQNVSPNAGCTIDGKFYDVRNLLHEIARLTAELATARAETAMAFEVAAQCAYNTDAKAFRAKYEADYKGRKRWDVMQLRSAENKCMDIQSEDSAEAIRSLTPAHAAAALAARDKATLEAALREAQPAQQVKALEWDGFTSGNYRIEVEKGGVAKLLYYSAAIFEDEEPEHLMGGYLSLISMDDLKAAAQDHHERRILSALSGEAQR